MIGWSIKWLIDWLLDPLPSGNQTWQWKTDHLSVIVLLNPPLISIEFRDFPASHVWWHQSVYGERDSQIHPIPGRLTMKNCRWPSRSRGVTMGNHLFTGATTMSRPSTANWTHTYWGIYMVIPWKLQVLDSKINVFPSKTVMNPNRQSWHQQIYWDNR